MEINQSQIPQIPRITEKSKLRKYLPHLIALSVIAIIIFVTVLVMSSSIKACEDRDCFIEAANKCKNADMVTINEVGVFYLSTDDCMLTKTLVSPNEEETEEMQSLLTMKGMDCIYTEGNFNDDWVDSPINGIEECQGDLVNIFNALSEFA